MPRTRVALATLIAALATAAPASAGVAPGRVTFPFGPTAIVNNVDPFAPSLGVALRLVLAGRTVTGRRYLRHARHVRVAVTATFRDLLRGDATARARGLLR